MYVEVDHYSSHLVAVWLILPLQLSHNTTWKELKAFAAQACEVDHAEVYTPTSGFVRVKGLANFEKAFSKPEIPLGLRFSSGLTLTVQNRALERQHPRVPLPSGGRQEQDTSNCG
jgi:hypothetical protein